MNAVVAPVGDVNAIRFERQSTREIELPAARARTSPLAEELPVGVELLDAVQAEVTDVDIARIVHGDVDRRLELAIAAARSTPATEDRAVAVELQDAGAPEIRGIGVAARLERQPTRRVHGPSRKQHPVGCELLNPVVQIGAK